MDGNARHVAPTSLDLSDMKPCSEFRAKSPYRISDGEGAVDCAGGTVERGEHAITSRLHQSSTKANQLAIYRLVVLVETVFPGPVAQGRCLLG